MGAQEVFRRRSDKFRTCEVKGVRISIGASDLSSASFTYNDMPKGKTDLGLDRFRLAAGDTQMIPVLREILAINPDIGIIATPWTAPPWMKSGESFTGGFLKRECYRVYAKYIVTYLKEMQSFGIRIKAITPQNEPLNLTDDPSMGMSGLSQRRVGRRRDTAIRRRRCLASLWWQAERNVQGRQKASRYQDLLYRAMGAGRGTIWR
jgi:O-glycosyl hydrolase